MQYVLYILSTLMFFSALLSSMQATTIIQQIYGAIGYISAAILFAGGAIVGAIHLNSDTVSGRIKAAMNEWLEIQHKQRG